MKRLIVALGFVVIAIAGCKEKAPPINLLPDVAAKDTTYVVTPAPAAEQHNVLVEDFTGAQCPNCPAAHKILEQLDSQYNTPNIRINVLSMHILDPNFSQTKPYGTAKYDFRQQQARDVSDNIYGGINAIPVGGIDRKVFNGLLKIGRGDWISLITEGMAAQDSVNLDVTSSFDSASKKASIKVKVTWPFATSAAQNLSIAIVEDGFIDMQEDGEFVDTFYHFNDIFRGFVTSSPYGDPLLATISPKEAGRVFERTYVYAVNAAWNPANCRVIAFVHRDASVGGVNIYQSKQTKLKR